MLMQVYNFPYLDKLSIGLIPNINVRLIVLKYGEQVKQFQTMNVLVNQELLINKNLLVKAQIAVLFFQVL
jgi:hypothetical protein